MVYDTENIEDYIETFNLTAVLRLTGKEKCSQNPNLYDYNVKPICMYIVACLSACLFVCAVPWFLHVEKWNGKLQDRLSPTFSHLALTAAIQPLSTSPWPFCPAFTGPPIRFKERLADPNKRRSGKSFSFTFTSIDGAILSPHNCLKLISVL